MGLELVDRLGAEVELRWQATDYDPRHFSDIATRALAEVDLPGRIRPDDVVDWVLKERIPRQECLPATFGQPPITLYQSKRFYIESLFWIDGSTSIHQHAFSGAFQVLDGSSIETRYSFAPARLVDGHFAIGTLEVESATLLRRGDIRPISSGLGRLIHALFHLERPSVTMVVRTFRDVGAGPQFQYARPGLAHDPFFEEETLARSVEVVRLLRQIEHPDLETKVGDLVARLDLHGAYRVLMECAALPDRALFERLLGRVRDDSVVEVFRAAFEETRRLKFLVSRRAFVQEPELRFLIGVLLNAHRRSDLLTLVRSRVPDRDPAVQAASWVRQLAATSLKLQAAGTPWQPNVLGLPEMDDALERALANELAGGGPPGGEAETRFLATLRGIPSLAALFG